MDKPKEKQTRPDPYFPGVICPADEENVIYNAGRADMEAWHSWRMGKLPDVDEIYTICIKTGGDHTLEYLGELAKAIHARLAEVKET